MVTLGSTGNKPVAGVCNAEPVFDEADFAAGVAGLRAGVVLFFTWANTLPLVSNNAAAHIKPVFLKFMFGNRKLICAKMQKRKG